MRQTNRTGSMATQQEQRQKRANSANFLHYSGPMVNMAYVDQCASQNSNQHLPENERTDHWEPLGLDHQSGYSYLYQHSGYEWAEGDQEKQQQASRKMNERQILD